MSWSKIIRVLPAIGLMSACTPNSSDWAKPATLTLSCDAFESITVDGAVLYNNMWNAGAAGSANFEQCLERQPGAEPYTYGWSWNWPNEGRQIFAYPQIKTGSSPWDPLPRIDDRFPARLSDLDALVVSHALDIDTNGQHNVATSLWLTTEPNLKDEPDRSIIAAEIMVWSYYTPGHMNPAGEKRDVIEVDGQQWSVWIDENWRDMSGQNDNRWTYVTFRSETPSLTAQFDVAKLLGHLAVSSLRLSDTYVADVELGTEIMRGSGLAWVRQFDVQMEMRSAAAEP